MERNCINDVSLIQTRFNADDKHFFRFHGGDKLDNYLYHNLTNIIKLCSIAVSSCQNCVSRFDYIPHVKLGLDEASVSACADVVGGFLPHRPSFWAAITLVPMKRGKNNMSFTRLEGDVFSAIGLGAIRNSVIEIGP